VETDLDKLNKEQLDDRLLKIENVMESLDQLGPRLINADSQVRQLTVEDPEADLLSATVAGLRTRHATLESQANRFKQKVKDADRDKTRRDEELRRYQSLLVDLDQWVNSTRNKLKTVLPKFTSVKAVLKEMDSSKTLEKDLIERSTQLTELVNRCAELRAFSETAPLAEQLYSHLSVLQQSFTEAGAQLQSRLVFLQV
jgi:DNA repair exonuclease SbcCD ATPase subunit